MGKSNGLAGPNTSKSTRSPQRIVLLAGDEHGEVKSVLAEYPGADLEKVNVNEEVPKFAADHAGKFVTVEWRTGWAGGGSCGVGGEATDDASEKSCVTAGIQGVMSLYIPMLKGQPRQ